MKLGYVLLNSQQMIIQGIYIIVNILFVVVGVYPFLFLTFELISYALS